MENNLTNRLNRILRNRLAIGTLALGMSLSALPASAQQDQQQDQQNQQQDQQQYQQPPDQSQSQQNQAPQPPPPPQQPMPPDSSDQAPPQDAPPQTAVVPDTLALPANTIVQVRTSDWLSSDHNKVGDQVILTLDKPLVADGWVVARRGQTVIATVTEAQKAGRVKGVSRLGLQLNQITFVDGQLVDIKSQLMHATAGTSNGRDALAIAGTTGFGAAVGAAAAGGPGAAIGAGAGFVASIAGVLVTRGKPTVFPPETLLTFKIEEPISISTTHGQMAFRAVTPQDYGTTATRNRLRRPAPYYGYGYGYPPPQPYGGYYYYPYPYAYGIGFYPAPFYFGYYGGWYGRRWR
jgi:hypothetical protein